MDNSNDYSRYYEQIAERVLLHYTKKQANDSELKSLDTRISNAKREIDDCTNAFIDAKNPLLREKIENKISDCEKLIENLKLQRAQLELEKKANITKQDALEIVKKYMNVNEQEHEFKGRFVDVTIRKILCWNDAITIFLDLIDDKENCI